MPSTMPRLSSRSLTLMATSLGFVLIILDVTAVNVAMAQIGLSLRVAITGLQWVANAYTLVFASLLLTAGVLGDRLGSKRVFLAGFGLFTAASLACGLAEDIQALILARIAQGVGATLCVPTSLSLVSAAFPAPAERSRAVSIWAGAGGLALALGPVLGGVMVGRFGWPGIFFLNLPVGLLGLWLTIRHAPEGHKTTGRGLDLPGQLLAVLALGCLTAGCIESGPLGWTDPLVLGCFVCFVTAAAALLLVEARRAQPMLPPALFRSRAFSVSCFSGFTVNLSFYGLMFVLSLFFQSVKHYSPLLTGLAFLPMTAFVTVMNLIAGWMVARFGPKLPMALGQALAAFGYLALSGIGAATPYDFVAGPLIAAGAGVALVVPAITSAVLASVDKAQAGIASGVLNAARQTGGVVGVSLFGALIAGNARGFVNGMHLALILAGIALAIGCLLSLILAKAEQEHIDITKHEPRQA